jgi:cruciform cutting endonuclease 1
LLHVWKRIPLQAWLDAPAIDVDPEATTSANVAGVAESAADLRPPLLAKSAVKLVQEHLLPMRPTHVLLERQRFRSGGGSNVQEWTIRVNTLEAMLYAVFSTLAAHDHWRGTLQPMDPKRVTTFILGDRRDGEAEDKPASKPSPSAVSKRQKLAKIQLVGNWLREGMGVTPAADQAKDAAALFLDRYQYMSNRGNARRSQPLRTMLSEESKEPLTKLDDMADSLTQGVTWFRWQANTAAAVQDVTALLPVEER